MIVSRLVGNLKEIHFQTDACFSGATACLSCLAMDAAFRLNKIDNVSDQIRQLVESNESASMQFVRQALHGRMRAHSSSVNATCASEL